MNNKFFNNNYSFNLRKDNRDTTQISLINALLLNAYISRDSLATAKTFINNTIYSLTNLNTVVQTKPDIAQINDIVQSTVQETVQETVSNVVDTQIQEKVDTQIQQAISVINIEKENALNAIHSYIGAGSSEYLNNSIQLAITQINTEKEQMLNEINIEKQNAINEIHSYNGAGFNSSIQLAITQLNNKNQEVLNEINSLAASVSNQIANMNTYTKEELLQKIDFLFEMFYHADSETIMELYPL